MEIKLSEEYLKQVLDFTGSALVGKMLKRFEIHQDKNVIKAELKELVYEQMRHLKDILLAHNSGRNFKWNFK